MGLKKIQFDDLNFDENYNPSNTYAHSKLAIMMFGYELQRRVRAANKSFHVQVCHPGASRTELLKGDNLNRLAKAAWAVMAPIVAQSAEKGAWPSVMCATEEGVKSETLYGPTRRNELVGPVDECSIENLVLDQEDAARLWTISEQKTSSSWSL
jgi:NAD(P)-dependent dehydrogenase (short-subunit alcohol dehydrogenase family)